MRVPRFLISSSTSARAGTPSAKAPATAVRSDAASNLEIRIQFSFQVDGCTQATGFLADTRCPPHGIQLVAYATLGIPAATGPDPEQVPGGTALRDLRAREPGQARGVTLP